MARYVIDTTTALKILEHETSPRGAYELLAPTLLRSLVLDALYARARSSAAAKTRAQALNARFAKLKVRYLGDAVLRRRAWSLAEEADCASTFDAEFVALTQLQGDALVTEKAELVALAERFVAVAPFEALRR